MSRLVAAGLRALHKGSKKTPKPAPPGKAKKFSSALEEARAAMDPQSRMQVDPLPDGFTGDLYLSADGQTGYAISRSGELVHAFNHPANPSRGAMDAILTSARAEGATHLHGFDKLAQGYTKRGAIETNRYPWDPAEAAKLTEWDTGTMGTPDYVRMDIGGALAERPVAGAPQGALERRTPSAIKREEAGKPPLGANADEFMAHTATPENRARIMDYVRKGMEQGGDKWYHTGGIKDKFIEVLGPEQGAASFDKFMALKAATSPKSPVDANLKRASIPYQSHMRGGSVDLPYSDYPPGYGSKFHGTHEPALKRLAESGLLGSPDDQMKITSYFDNLTGNLDPVTVDSHNYHIWTGQKSAAPKNQAEYRAMENLQREMAAELGISPAEFQSALWVGAADVTGVADPRNITAALNQRVAATARHHGIPEEEAFAMFARGETQLYSHPVANAAAGAGAMGVLAAPEEAEAGMGAGALVRQGAKSAVKPKSKVRTPETFRQGVHDIMGNLGAHGIDRETAANRILSDIAELQQIKPGPNRYFTQESKDALLADLYDVYGRLQTPEAAGRPALWNKTTDIPGEPGALYDTGMQQLKNAADETPQGHRVFRHNDTQFDPFSFMDDPLARDLPTEQFGALMDEGRELAAIDRSMRQMPDAYNTGLAQGKFVRDPFDEWMPPKPEEGRVYLPEEVAAENATRGLPTAAAGGALAVAGTASAGEKERVSNNDLQAFFEAENPHPSKSLQRVPGATGMRSVLDPEAEDPGILASPTLMESDGRVMERPSAGELIRERNSLGRLGEMVAAVPEFGRDMARHYGRMIGGGLASVFTAPFELGLSQLTTGGIDQGVDSLNRRLEGVQGMIQEPSGEDAISEELGRLLSHPAVMSKIEELMEADLRLQDTAFEKGRGAYVGYHAATRLPLNL